MKYLSDICIDAGTENCPCPLAMTGDCLVCSRLAGESKCDCSWCGLCIYNEFIHNGSSARRVRQNKEVEIEEKKWLNENLFILTVKVSKELAMKAAVPGAFVFLNGTDEDFFAVPISVMHADVQKCRLRFAIRVISGKTKALAKAEESIKLRGVYRNGLLGSWDSGRVNGGTWDGADDGTAEKWLIITRGTGISPAVNLIKWMGPKNSIDLLIDTENITEELVEECLRACGKAADRVSIAYTSLLNIITGGGDKLIAEGREYSRGDYDKVVILASDYYIRNIAEKMKIPAAKLVSANNFNMCCGEGICGACSFADDAGHNRKMCKCRQSAWEQE